VTTIRTVPRSDSDAPPARQRRRRGPRADAADTRGAVLQAARARFAARGYDGTRLRDVAADADVDVALVSYFFGSKDGLFAAAMELPINPAQLVEELVREGSDRLGERLVRTVLTRLDEAGGGAFVGLVRSAATNEQAAELLREFVEREMLGRLALAIDAPDPELRAGLAGSQIVGLIMARYVVGVRPLAGTDAETLARAIGPTLQRYLTGELSGSRTASRRP
jgi:AcrR family transcriptional regulator